jgi:hypothetical protein
MPYSGAPGLHQWHHLAHVHLEVDGGERLVLRAVGADELGPVHARERHQIGAWDHGDAVRPQLTS